MAAIDLTITGGTPSSVSLLTLTNNSGSTPAGVTLPEAFTLAGGVWSATFTPAAGSCIYNYTWSMTFSDGSVYGPYNGVWSAPPVTASGLYASLCDLTTRFGCTNIATWSNLDGGTTINVARVQEALAEADSEIISTFLNFGNYISPLQPLGYDVATVRRWDVILAGTWLYESRGFRDGDDATGDRLHALVEEVRAEMRAYRAVNKLNAARRWPTSTAPVTVGP
jgi:hypothetical protein